MVKMLNAAPQGNPALIKWVQEWAELCQPNGIYWCDGSQEEYDRLAEECVQSGLAIRLNPEKRPNSLLFRSDPRNVPSSPLSKRKMPVRPTTGSTPSNSRKP